mmetsp:Transcript_48860/g.157821  ORF Transcript_48860/g.157821 Transcript_48860/m.157821 type:complete len:776 (-) Transcript_48860:116-2443(-)
MAGEARARPKVRARKPTEEALAGARWAQQKPCSAAELVRERLMALCTQIEQKDPIAASASAGVGSAGHEEMSGVGEVAGARHRAGSGASSSGSGPGHRRRRGRSAGSRRDGSVSSRSEAEPADPDTTTMSFIPAEAAFITGKNQASVTKIIARATGAETKLRNYNRFLDITGDLKAWERAKKYIGFVLAQMKWPVRMSDEDIDKDCSMVQIPDVSVGFVTGTNGSHLRRLEEEWGVLMLFAEYTGSSVCPSSGSMGRGVAPCRTETLAIFGPKRARRGAQLSMMQVVDEKLPGYFSDATRSKGELYDPPDDSDDAPSGWGTLTMEVREAIMPYAQGKNASTRKKLMQASGAIVQFLGNIAFMSGTAEQRSRAQEYLTWLLQTLDGPVWVDTPEARSDCTIVDVPGPIVGFVTGKARESLSRHEEEWGVLAIFIGHCGQRGGPPPEAVVKLLIFGPERSRKGCEIDVLCAIEFKAKGFVTDHMTELYSEADGCAEERRIMNEVEISYALGIKGATRKKLASASGAILNFVGTVCCIAGTGEERQRCKDYLGWLLAKLDNDGHATIDTTGRTDVTEIRLHGLNNKAIGVVTGKGGNTLQGVSSVTGTWCIVAKDACGQERLCIFSHNKGSWNSEEDGGRRRAERLFRAVLKEAKRFTDWENRRSHSSDWKQRGSRDWNQGRAWSSQPGGYGSWEQGWSSSGWKDQRGGWGKGNGWGQKQEYRAPGKAPWSARGRPPSRSRSDSRSLSRSVPWRRHRSRSRSLPRKYQQRYERGSGRW